MVGSCVSRYEFEYEDASDDPFDQLVTGLRNKAKRELSDRFDAWKPDLADIDQIERTHGVLRHIWQNDGFLNGNRDKGDTIKVRQNQFAPARHPPPFR